MGSKRKKPKSKKKQQKERKSLSDVVGPSSPVKSPLLYSLSLSLCLYVSHSVALPFSLSHGCNYYRVNKRGQGETSGIPACGSCAAYTITQNDTHTYTEDL